MPQNLKVLFSLIFIVTVCIIKTASSQNNYCLANYYQQKSTDKLCTKTLDTTNSFEFGFGDISSISCRNKHRYTWDEYYYLGLNNSFLLYLKYKQHSLLAGPSLVYIPQISINSYSNNIKESNFGIFLGYKYYLKNFSEDYRILIQYFFRYTNIDYQTYSLGQGLYQSDYNSIENTIGLAIEYEVSNCLYCFIGLNVGFRDKLEQNDDIIGTGDIGIFYKF